MTEKTGRQANDLRPEAQQGEEHGTIKGEQITGRNSPEKDRPRGSEPEAHARR